MAVAPLANASRANPLPHTFVGDGAISASVSLDSTGVLTSTAEFSSVTLGVCADVTPIVGTITPPTLVRDGVPETGVGGGCFPFSSVYGDDTGSTVVVHAEEVGLMAPVYIACVDVDGDGICAPTTGDEYNVCAHTRAGDVSILVASTPCTIYENPSATANPFVYVAVVASLSVDGTTVVPQATPTGSIWLVN